MRYRVAGSMTPGVIARSRLTISRASVEPAHMRVAGSENAVGHRRTPSSFERLEQVCRRLVEPSTEEVGFANTIDVGCWTITRVKAQGGLEMPDRETRLAGKDPEHAAPVPAGSEARVEGEAMIDQPDRDIDVLAEISEHKGDECEDIRVIRADPQCLSSKVDTAAPSRFRVFGPASLLEPLVTMSRQSESRPYCGSVLLLVRAGRAPE